MGTSPWNRKFIRVFERCGNIFIDGNENKHHTHNTIPAQHQLLLYGALIVASLFIHSILCRRGIYRHKFAAPKAQNNA